MSTLQSSLYAVALACCLLLLFMARQSWRENRRHTRYLMALLLLQSLNFAFEWLMSNPSTPAKSLWLTGVMAVAFSLGPCLWLYARAITEPAAPRLRDFPRRHLVPVVLGLLLLLPLLERTHLGTDFMRAEETTTRAHSLFIHSTMFAAAVIFVGQAFHYLRACLQILQRQSRAAKALFSDLEDRELNTLRLLIFAVGAHWAVGIARTLHCLIVGKNASFVVMFAIVEVMITLWALIMVMRSTVVHAGDRRLADELSRESTEPRYARSALDDPARARITRKLSEAWSSQRLHRDSRLTLRLLCERLRENPHYVSQVINQDLGTNFYDLVNRQRIRDAMDELLRQPERPVLEIALEAGFNSKSTFNAAFRQYAGTTPSQFRAGGARPDMAVTSGPSG